MAREGEGGTEGVDIERREIVATEREERGKKTGRESGENVLGSLTPCYGETSA